MLFGGGNTDFWYDIFILAKGFTPVYATVEELIMAKYLRNSFLATKVAFFNEVHHFCMMNDISYEKLSELVGMDERITHSHMKVPDQMAKKDLVGLVFLKDTKALLYTGLFYKDLFNFK